MKIFEYCTSKEFKNDISNLCDNCPIRPKIIEGIENQIIFQAMERKDILSEKDFNHYIQSEINDASKAMERVFLHERQAPTIDPKGIYIENRSRTYIWNKERIKALRKITYNQNNNTSVNPYPHIFKGKDNQSYSLFLNYTKQHIIDTYIDYSFIFQQMLNDKHIHKTTHHEFMNWLIENKIISQKEYETLKVKGQFYSLLKSTNASRLNNYNNIKKDLFEDIS